MKYLFLILFLFLLFFILMIINLLQHIFRLNAENKKLEDQLSQNTQKQRELLQKQIDLAILQAQINPHFLYNTLEAIRSQAEIEDQTEIAMATEALGSNFRYCINSHGEPVHLFEELQNIQDYYQLVRFRFFDRIRLEINIHDSSVLQTFLPRMTIQPIVENAINHGLKDKIKDAEIIINANCSDNIVYLTISDNGCGMEEEALEALMARISHPVELIPTTVRHHGIALSNVHHRLQILFGSTYGLNIKSFPGEGTDVLITYPIDYIPIIKEQNERVYPLDQSDH